MNEFIQSLVSMLPSAISEVSIKKNELVIIVDSTRIQDVMFFLKHHVNSQYRVLIDICGVDYTSRMKRFDVVYHLLSIDYNSRIRIKTSVDEYSSINSVTNVFESANWWERETYDMYGIYFAGHPDLRRILTDYGFEGYPLRKDFPLTGYVEVRYDHEKKRVVHESVELSQEFRNFEFTSPWETLINKNKE